MEHSFNIEIAQEVGVNKAILIKNMQFWLEKNKANDKHCYDGKYWTYNSGSAWAKLFPYMNQKTIERHLLELERDGYLETGNYNKSKMDRTKWYTLTSKTDNALLKMRDATTENEGTIPDVNTDEKQDILFDDFWNKFDKKVDKSKCEKKWSRLTEEEQNAALVSVDSYVETTPNKKYRKNPLTWLNGKCWNDEDDFSNLEKIRKAVNMLAISKEVKLESKSEYDIYLGVNYDYAKTLTNTYPLELIAKTFAFCVQERSSVPWGLEAVLKNIQHVKTHGVKVNDVNKIKKWCDDLLEDSNNYLTMQTWSN